jgi:hypothetical protein
MDDDKLLASIGALAARQGERSTWERVVTREASAEDLAELERLAAADPEARALLEASRPLDDLAQERIARALTARLSPARRPMRSRIGMAAAGLALAAGVALFFGLSDRETGLPLYALDSSGAATSRAPAAAAVACVVRADTRGSFELLARPNDAVVGPIAAKAFIVRGAEVQPFEGDLELAAKGSVRLTGENRALTGASELRIVVGRPDLIGPTDARAKAGAPSASGRGWQVLRCSIEGR